MEKSTIKDMSYIAIGVASIIAGGSFIIQMSLIFPIPGIKYILMSPFLSMVIFIVLSKVYHKLTVLKLGSVFGFIMMIMNIYMGLAILLTTIASQLTIMPIRDHQHRAQLGAILFSAYSGSFALIISKYLVGGVFKSIPTIWLLYTWVLCSIFGGLGTIIASKVLNHMNVYSYRQ